MLDSFSQIMLVIFYSKRTQWAILLGILFFIGIKFLGSKIINDYSVNGTMNIFTELIKQILQGKYDDAAWFALITFWGLAFNFYKKDRKNILR